jgi:hypothetical protein
MLWASFMGENKKIPNRYKTEKGAIMNEGTRNQLDVKLMNMLNHLDQARAKQKKPIPQPGTGNIIRRRKGEKDKRFTVCIEPRLCASAEGSNPKNDRLYYQMKSLDLNIPKRMPDLR